MKFAAIFVLISLLVLTGCDLPVAAPSVMAPSSVESAPTTPAPTAPGFTLPAAATLPATTSEPSVESPPTVSPATQSDASISRTYRWTYGGKDWTWELDLPEALYDYFKGLPRSPTSNYSIYVTNPLDDPYIQQLTDKIREAATQEGYSEYETVEFTACFVQSLPYVPDKVSTGYDEYPRYPIETLVDDGGDCEDTAILMASLTMDLGYGVVMLRFDATADHAGHMAVGVAGGDGIYGTYWEYNGTKYYYLETTNTGWDIGQIPDELKDSSAHVLAMVPVPILTDTWTSTGRGEYADLQIVVSNLGSAAAQGVYIYAGFDAGNDQEWNAVKSPEFDIGVDGKVTVTMSIRVPYGEHTRIIVQIIYDGYSVDNSYSRWIDT